MDAPANKCGTPSALRRRLLTGAALLGGLLMALFTASPPVWAVLMIAIAGIGAWEWAGLMRLEARARALYAGVTLLGLSLLAATGLEASAWVYLPALAFWLAVSPLWLRHDPARLPAWLLGALGWLLLLPPPLAMIHLRAEGPDLLLAVVGLVVVADSAAYFAGRRFGRRRLAPRISPGKTWEGLLGAWVAVTSYALLLGVAWQEGCSLACHGLLVVASWVLTTLSVLGDLFESWMKRQAGVKDSGRLLPGHGGVLDRIDGLLAVLPAAVLLWMGLR